MNTKLTSLERQIGEALEIGATDPSQLLNTKAEWGINPLPQNSVVFLDRVLEDHPDYRDSSQTPETTTGAKKRKTMATRTRESQEEAAQRIRGAREAQNAAKELDEFQGQ